MLSSPSCKYVVAIVRRFCKLIPAKHLYLSHFMSNPMSIYTVPVQDLNLDDNEFASVEAFLLTQAPMLRVLPSFRQHIRQIAETSESSPSRNGRRKAAANMLSSDASLLQAVRGARLERSSRLRSFRDGRKLFTILQDLQMTSAMDDRHMLRYYIKGQLLRHTRKACDNVRSVMRHTAEESGLIKSIGVRQRISVPLFWMQPVLHTSRLKNLFLATSKRTPLECSRFVKQRSARAGAVISLMVISWALSRNRLETETLLH